MSKKNFSSLDKITINYPEEEGFEKIRTKYKTIEILKFCKGKKALDLGCGVGLVTRKLGDYFEEVIGIDKSKLKIEKAKKNFQKANIKYIWTTFNKYNPKKKFDTILLANVLEHVNNPMILLKKASNLLEPKGRIIATVPNALALNKRIGKELGLIKNLYELTKEDIKKGHRRIYDKKILKNHFEEAHLKIIYLGGFFLKPLSNEQMESWNKETINALYQVGSEIDNFCSSLIIVGEKS